MYTARIMFLVVMIPLLCNIDGILESESKSQWSSSFFFLNRLPADAVHAFSPPDISIADSTF